MHLSFSFTFIYYVYNRRFPHVTIWEIYFFFFTGQVQQIVALAHSTMPVCIVETIQYKIDKKKYTKLEY